MNDIAQVLQKINVYKQSTEKTLIAIKNMKPPRADINHIPPNSPTKSVPPNLPIADEK